MPKKRRNGGRSKHNRGHVRFLRCNNCGRCVPKDKAIKRFNVRNVVDVSSRNDIREASVYQSYNLPKLYIKNTYCISCALHSKILRVRSVENRKKPFVPPFRKPLDQGPPGGGGGARPGIGGPPGGMGVGPRPGGQMVGGAPYRAA
eukprot:CAMPEP_0113857506 /NCGR_PEP_ID=MMETSP0372-20130328/10263_1 /TAXON_ID=340204 /ORGANISM="Lankesteria abbotti" /LENGTH=145 /DNA_ID=CAMNT_0000833493 /DNA_START=33 /DNA_END=470 /DNA_ORIENTATION=- /assembly_acc=CAM_ASM_000359